MSKFDDDINDAIKSFGDKIPKHKAMSKEDSKPDTINDLLAILHGDGGHYTEKHGLQKSIQDACELIHKKWVTNGSLNDINELSNQLARAKEHLEGCKMIFDKLGYTETSNMIESFLKS